MEKEKKPKKKVIIDFFRNVLFVILLIFVVFLVIISLGVALVYFDNINKENKYKDDWELMAEWQEKQRIMNEGKK